ncbi:MAG TPA: hypothetical protein VNK95_19560 [Caldilineaceae bacterium]|nr:hypothetical protein [Caldilineaceae bacterium]
MMTVEQPALERNRSGRRDRLTLWGGFLSGPVIHSIYFLIVYVLGEFGCLAGLGAVTVFGMGVILLVTVVLTVISAAATLVFGIGAYRRWRRIRSQTARWPDDPGGFMSFTGTWLNGFYTVLILLTGIQTLFLEVCEWV